MEMEFPPLLVVKALAVDSKLFTSCLTFVWPDMLCCLFDYWCGGGKAPKNLNKWFSRISFKPAEEKRGGRGRNRNSWIRLWEASRRNIPKCLQFYVFLSFDF
mmetsp:Transcript_1060/g.3132  ORF Transcript_1060/g.3132 Transcript_1060/m.3132 type:complete len:102 (+) Transcript_1060:2956-3261(+)